jgi:DNA-binding Lrp family transcriptional regulator
MAAHKTPNYRAKNQEIQVFGDKPVHRLIDSLNIKIIRELISNPDISSTEIATKFGIPLSTIQRRRAKLETSIISKTYNLDLRKLGWRMGDLLITVEKGKAEETARKLLDANRVNVIMASLRIGHPQVDIMADVFYRDSIELHELTEKVKAMPFVTFVEWAEVVKVVGSNPISILDKVFTRENPREQYDN